MPILFRYPVQCLRPAVSYDRRSSERVRLCGPHSLPQHRCWKPKHLNHFNGSLTEFNTTW